MFHDQEILERLDRIERLLWLVFRKERQIMSDVDNKIAALKAEVENGTTVEKSALALIQGIPALIADAVSKAQSAGATPEQLQALTDLQTQLASNDSELSAAVTANTPAAAAPGA
jgi:hypothetical protein